MKESEIQHAIRLALGRHPDARLFRNNVGSAQQGGHHVRYGLAKGSSDLIGIVRVAPVIETGRFVSLEVKTDSGKPTPEQLQWMAMIRRFGGFASVVRSVEEAVAAIDRARSGASE